MTTEHEFLTHDATRYTVNAHRLPCPGDANGHARPSLKSACLNLAALSALAFACSSSPNGLANIDDAGIGGKSATDDASDAGETGGGGSKPVGASDLLKDLGVTDTPAQTYKNSTGLTVTPPANWQPMRKPASVFYPTSEVFVAGTEYNAQKDGNYNVLFDDLTVANTAPTLLATPFDTVGAQPAMKSQTKVSVAADIDGDGIQEIIVFSVGGTPSTVVNSLTTQEDVDKSQNREIDFFVYRHDTAAGADAGADTTSFGPVNSKITYVSNADYVSVQTPGYEGHVWAPMISAKKGDIDGDGIDEIFLAAVNKVYILAVPSSADGVLTIIGTLTFDTEVVSIATGDADGDGRDEFVICERYSQCAFYDGYTKGTNALWYYTNTDAAVAMLATGFGDFDGDGVDEFAIARGYNINCAATAKANIYKVTVTGMNAVTGLATGLNIGKPLTTSLATASSAVAAMTCENGGSEDFWPLQVRGVDMDGDGIDELYMHNTVFRNVLGSPTPLPLRPVFDTPAGTETILDVQVGMVNQANITSALGSRTQRAKEHLVVLSLSQSGNWYDVLKLQAFGMNTSSSTPALESTESYLTTINNTGDTTTNLNRAFTQYALAVGNFDNDSRRMKILSHELTYSDPLVLAVLSSAPYWQSVADTDATYAGNFPAWATSFGTSTAYSTESTNSVGATVGFGIAYEQSLSLFGFNIASFKTSLEFEASANVEWAHSKEITTSITFTDGGGENRAIFTAVPLDKYSYEILASPTASEIGKTVDISIPRKFSKYSLPLDEFNQVTGLAIPVSHTLGQPFSYPTSADANALLAKYPGGYASEAANVSSGGTAASPGVSGLEIDVANGSTTTFAADASMTLSVEAGAGGLTAMSKLGFNVGYSYSQTTTTSTTFAGTVGYLPSPYYSDDAYKYSSTLFVYPYPNSYIGRTYWVLDYAVDGN